ncbi:MAG: murein biosynthesis integral membrane protein MurJ [Acidimicrobiia bacterium]|nr:murein biosynthesis integral membrane protein MurJ [Acidimicrobiia bacterium]
MTDGQPPIPSDPSESDLDLGEGEAFAIESGGRRLVRSSAVVGAGTALSRATGMLRVGAIAFALGATATADTFNIANMAPAIVYELILGGVLSATLVPVFVEHLRDPDDDAASAVTTVAMVGLGILAVVGVLAAPLIMRVLALLASDDVKDDQLALGTDLLRLLIPQVLFFGFVALASAVLNARRRFAAPAFVPILNNVVVISAFLAVAAVAGGDVSLDAVLSDTGLILLMGLGTTAGIAAMAVALYPALRHAGVRLRPLFTLRHPAVRKVARLSGWTFGYVLANQAAFLVVLILAFSRRGEVSAYQYAFIFFQLPHGLFAVSIMTAITPDFARSATRRDWADLRNRFSYGMRLMGLLVLPTSVGFFVITRTVDTTTLTFGELSASSAALTAQTLSAFALGMFAFSAYLYSLRVFYAMQDTRTPFLLNCAENGLNIVLALALFPSLGVRGLALAWSISYCFATMLTLVVLRRRLGRLDGGRILHSLGRMLVACAVLGVVAWAVIDGLGTATRGRALVVVGLAVILGAASYFAVLAAMRVEEIRGIRSLLKGKSPPVA